MRGRKFFVSAVSAGALQLISFGGTYSLSESTIDTGGGASSSESYSVETSAGGAFFAAEGATSASGVMFGFGFASQLNEPPVTQFNQIQRLPGEPLEIPLSDLLQKVFDVEGQSFVLVSVSPTSQRGVPIEIREDSVLYDSTSDADSLDAFTYIVADESGATSQGTVVIRTGNPASQAPTLVIQVFGKAVRLTFVGSPGHSYQIQATESLASGSWRNIGGAVADVGGGYTFLDQSAGGAKVRFYRSVEL